MNDLHGMTLVEAAGAIAARKLSPVELMSALLGRIGRLDSKLNVFIRLDGEAAMAEARAAEAEIVSGRLRGPLHGVPVGIKDIIDVAGLPTTRHSKISIWRRRTPRARCRTQTPRLSPSAAERLLKLPGRGEDLVGRTIDAVVRLLGSTGLAGTRERGPERQRFRRAQRGRN